MADRFEAVVKSPARWCICKTLFKIIVLKLDRVNAPSSSSSGAPSISQLQRLYR